MSRPTGQIHVYNLALDHLGEAPISSVDNPETKAENLCARWGDHSRRAVLRLHSWNFATIRALLPAEAAAPAFEYTQSFKAPNDIVRLNSLGEFGEIKDYQYENFKILTKGQATPLPVKYIYDFKDVSKMDPLFIELWALRLAIKINKPLTGSLDSRALIAEFEEVLAFATAIDGQERPPDRIENSRYRRAHNYGLGSRSRDPRYVFED